MTVDDPAPLVVVTAVSKTFGSGESAVVAVHGVSGSVPAGARIAITGASGSGKSTLVHILAGLEHPTHGTVAWPGLISGGRPGRQIGLVFQGPSLLPPLTVLENVALPLVISGVLEAEAQDRAHSALRTLDIDQLSAKLPDEISGGQSQRVAVARALAIAPPLILADEPTGQLDQGTAAHVLDVLLAAADQLGAALVVSTHDPAVVQRLGTRWLMRDGMVTGLSSDERFGAHR
jgi:putative ABC transport system ATP-binding protein